MKVTRHDQTAVASKTLDPVNLVLLIVAGICVLAYLAYNHVLTKKTEAVESVTDTVTKAVKSAGEVVKDVAKDVNGTSKEPGVVGDLSGKVKDAAKSIDPKDVVRSGAEIVHDISRTTADIANEFIGFTLEEEWQWGAKLRTTLLAQMKLSEDEQAIARIQRIAEPLLPMLTRTKGRLYTFTLVEDPAMNAFSILGGNVFVFRGLLDEMTSDSALRGVIAHEMGHVDLGHCAKGSAPALRAQEVSGDLGGLVVGNLHRLILLGYSEQQEFEADFFAYNTLKKYGTNKSDRVLFLRVLQEYAEKNNIHDDLDQKSDSIGGQIGKEVRKHYRSHPPSPERLRRLEQRPD